MHARKSEGNPDSVTSRQAKKILARELCAGILATDTGYAFCERVAMDNVAMMHSPMNLQA